MCDRSSRDGAIYPSLSAYLLDARLSNPPPQQQQQSVFRTMNNFRRSRRLMLQENSYGFGFYTGRDGRAQLGMDNVCYVTTTEDRKMRCVLAPSQTHLDSLYVLTLGAGRCFHRFSDCSGRNRRGNTTMRKNDSTQQADDCISCCLKSSTTKVGCSRLPTRKITQRHATPAPFGKRVLY